MFFTMLPADTGLFKIKNRTNPTKSSQSILRSDKADGTGKLAPFLKDAIAPCSSTETPKALPLPSYSTRHDSGSASRKEGFRQGSLRLGVNFSPESADLRTVAVDTPTGQDATERIQRLIDELKRLPAQPNAAMRVLWALDDSSTSAGELARLVEADPALSARIMQLANTAQYGLFRRVSSAAHAIMVVGFVTVRALAVGSACGLFVDKKRSVPDGFWAHSAATAAAASVLAEFTNAALCDAFSAGILHDIGIALLFRESPDDYDKVIATVIEEQRPLEEVETQILGISHTGVAEAVLTAWNFPTPFVEALASHHQAPADVNALGKSVIAGRMFANRLGYTMTYDENIDDEIITACTGLEGERIDGVAERVQEQIDELAALFAW